MRSKIGFQQLTPLRPMEEEKVRNL